MATRSLTASCRPLLRSRRLCYFSSAPQESNRREKSKETLAKDTAAKQPFVQARIRPGEWDPETRTNPLYRPRFKARTRILSEDDLLKQPTVGFTGEFETLKEAMVTLSWMDQADQQEIYKLYLHLMDHSHEAHGGRTSHEYIMRVIAQKYNITPERAAGVVQLQHNEEQLKRDPKVKLLQDEADYMDASIKQEIKDCYKTFGMELEKDFIEDPVAISRLKESKKYQTVEDLLDLDKITKDTIVRDNERARMLIDGHVYVEDVDEDTVPIPIDADAKKLLAAHKKLAKDASDPAPKSPHGPGRERWKYVAQTINTRKLKKKRSKTYSYTNNSPENTLVEHNGTLRSANLADIKQSSWKPLRHLAEHTYKGAKQGWLERTLRGDETAWGAAPEDETGEEKELDKTAQEGDVDDKEVTDSSSSSDEGGEASDEVGSSDEDGEASDEVGSSDEESSDGELYEEEKFEQEVEDDERD